MTANEYSKMSDSEKKKEDWMNAKWRPMMGWSYMLTCIADFVIFPVLWSILQSVSHGQVNVQWQPITLQGAGLFHVAMGAVLGIAAYGRTQEKMAGANNGGIQVPNNAGTNYTPPPPMNPVPQNNNNFGPTNTVSAPSSFNQPVQSQGFNSAPTSFNSGQVVTGFGGKPAPVQPPSPEI